MASTNGTKSLGTVLVVGGCGFLGSHLVDQLLNFPDETPSEGQLKVFHGESASVPPSSAFSCPSLRGRYPSYTNTDVHVLDLKCTHSRRKGASYHEADILSLPALLEVFRKVKPDVIINTVSPDPLVSPKPLLYKVNVTGAQNLIEVAAGEHGDWGGKCKALVHTSSSSIVHDTVSDLIGADERWPLVRPNPREYYSETKADAEVLVLEANKKHGGLLTCAIRPAGIIGERDSIVTLSMLKHAHYSPRWRLRMQLGGGENVFDWTYAGNVAYGILLAAERLLQSSQRISEGKVAPLDYEKVDGEAFIVTNDSPVSFWHTARYLMAVLGRPIEPSEVIVIPEGLAYLFGGVSELAGWVSGRKAGLTRAGVKYSSMIRYYSCDKAKMRLGYQPIVDIEEALARSTKAYLENLESQNVSGEKKSQ